MDTDHDPGISFDDQGICNYCKTYEVRVHNFVKKGEEGKRELDINIKNIQKSGKGNPYDCVIGLSGGVDSTYAAWISKKLGLRPLAVHFDNGWDSETAVQNIHQVVERLGIDLYSYVVDWEEKKDLQ